MKSLLGNLTITDWIKWTVATLTAGTSLTLYMHQNFATAKDIEQINANRSKDLGAVIDRLEALEKRLDRLEDKADRILEKMIK